MGGCSSPPIGQRVLPGHGRSPAAEVDGLGRSSLTCNASSDFHVCPTYDLCILPVGFIPERLIFLVSVVGGGFSLSHPPTTDCVCIPRLLTFVLISYLSHVLFEFPFPSLSH